MSDVLRLQFVIPVYNEEACIDELVRRLDTLQRNQQDLCIEAIFVNDGSTDGSLELLLLHAAKHRFVKIVNLSRNFGHQIAVSAGLDHSDADLVAIIDADLQDPPELVLEMCALQREGYDVVYGKRTKREGESLYKKVTAHIFYRLMNLICSVQIPEDTGDFRLITRRVVMALRGMPERHRFLRGLVAWVGYRSIALEYRRDSRFGGETKYPTRKMARLAMDAALSFSSLPLSIANYVGMAIAIAGFFAGAFVAYLRLFTPHSVPGITAVLIAVVILGGIQLMMLGLVGQYLGRIFEEAKGRPLYLVESAANLGGAETDPH